MILRALVLVVVFLVATVASAQSDGTSAEARLHFDRGVELYQEGSFDAALAEFERAHEISPNYKILYNIGQVQAERHEYVAAVELFNQYLREGASQITPERRQTVEGDIEKLRQRIATLSIQVNVAGAEVFVNDVSVGRTPLEAPVPVNAGALRVRAEKPGYVAKTQTMTVTGAERARVSFELVSGPTVARTTTIERSNMTPFWISLGASLVLGGTTAIVGGLTLGANHDLDEELNRLPADEDAIESARGKVKTMAGLTDGFGAATAVASVAALYFLIWPPEETEVVPAPSGVRASLTPSSNGVALSGTF